MGNFNSGGGNGGGGRNRFGNRGGGNRGFGGSGGGRGFGGGGRDFRRDSGRGDRQMFKAVCADCGNNCEVPFRPTGDKPVLCSTCFSGEAPRRMSAQPAESNDKQNEIIAKLDKILNLLQRTNPVKEVTVMKTETDEEEKEEKPKKAVTKKKAPVKKRLRLKQRRNSPSDFPPGIGRMQIGSHFLISV